MRVDSAHPFIEEPALGPFRSSSTRGEPQIWGVSEAMSAIRVLRTRRENNVQQGDATLPGGDLDPGPGPHLDQNVLAGYATVALASILDLCLLFIHPRAPNLLSC